MYLKIVVTAVRGGSSAGYVAVDDFNFEYMNVVEDCNIIPEDASPKVTTPPIVDSTTTSHQGKVTNCF